MGNKKGLRKFVVHEGKIESKNRSGKNGKLNVEEGKFK